MVNLGKYNIPYMDPMGNGSKIGAGFSGLLRILVREGFSKSEYEDGGPNIEMMSSWVSNIMSSPEKSSPGKKILFGDYDFHIPFVKLFGCKFHQDLKKNTKTSETSFLQNRNLQEFIAVFQRFDRDQSSECVSRQGPKGATILCCHFSEFLTFEYHNNFHSLLYWIIPSHFGNELFFVSDLAWCNFPQHHPTPKTCLTNCDSCWMCQVLFLCIKSSNHQVVLPGEMNPFDLRIFFKWIGEKPPTRSPLLPTFLGCIWVSFHLELAGFRLVSWSHEGCSQRGPRCHKKDVSNVLELHGKSIL